MSETTRRVETGQEPGTTHDMDDDDIDYVEESETCSDQSNWHKTSRDLKVSKWFRNSAFLSTMCITQVCTAIL